MTNGQNGAAQPGWCVQCGAVAATATARFCSECGATLSSTRRSQDVVDEILATRHATGERKVATVLFADIKGSTEVASGLDPEDWFLALERFHAIATRAIHDFSGVVTAYGGDGLMALFGAPVAHERHAAQGCGAALQLTESMIELAHELAPTLGTTLGVRVGLNSGEVVVGRIGGESRVDFTAQGLAVHVAARMEQIAAVGEIFVAPSTASQAADDFEFELVGDRMVKGLAEPVLVRRLIRPIGVPGQAPLSTRHRGPTLVGRTVQLERLRTSLTEAASGTPSSVAIVGPAGLGKTRLLREHVSQARQDGHDVVSVVGETTRSPGPMSVVARLARALLDLPADVGHEP